MLVYKKEITNFVSSVVIKMQPIAEIVANQYMVSKGLLKLDDEDNPYYIHLSGEYHSDDSPIYVRSLDTGEQIIFHRDILKNHPKTLIQYKLPNEDFLTLLNDNPDMHDFIRATLYSTVSIHTIVESDDFEILGYDTSLLQTNEKSSLVYALYEFLDYCVKRWYINTFSMDDYYPLVFAGTFFYGLITALHAQRISNLRTNNVHMFHVWEDLASNGLDDYRSVLSDEQALFLYRNIEYLERNKGSNSNLTILVDNILADGQVNLVSKLVVQDITNTKDNCYHNPVIISDPVDERTSLQEAMSGNRTDIKDFLNRLHTEGFDEARGSDELAALEIDYGKTVQTISRSQFVEIQKMFIDTRYENIMWEFALTTFAYLLYHDKVNFTLSLKESQTGTVIAIDCNEIFVLLNYLIHLEYGVERTYVPTTFNSRVVYSLAKPTINYNYTVDDIPCNLKNWLPMSEIEDELYYRNTNYTSKSNFVAFVESQFNVLYKHILLSRKCGDTQALVGYKYLYSQLLDQNEFVIDPGYTTYEEFFGLRPDILNIIDQIKDSGTQVADFANLILNTVFDFSKDFMLLYSDANKLNSDDYQKLKKLFIQLCSYNIAFLDTDRSSKSYITIGQTTTHSINITNGEDYMWTWLAPELSHVLIQENESSFKITSDFIQEKINNGASFNLETIPTFITVNTTHLEKDIYTISQIKPDTLTTSYSVSDQPSSYIEPTITYGE